MSNNTEEDSFTKPLGERTFVAAGGTSELPAGSCKTIASPSGQEIALCNVNGEFFAVQNFCPHQGAPLAEGNLCDYVIECGLHGWQFDVRTGECLTVPEKIETYAVLVEEGVVRIVV
ncbi:MAG TPA: Rieske 2Fe-2S domain-containing protein [Pyrinomonadaceae bacterium]|nr:Rieske 2Fe-2S domain-containing protein [Pyrinomonadaceae bacterium]